MTLTVCTEGSDGMFLASDSRGTFGDPRQLTAQNDTIKKLYAVSKYVGVIMSGANESGAMIMDEAERVIKQSNLEGATNIMQKMREIMRSRYNEWFPTFPMQAMQNVPVPPRPTLVVTIGGYDAGENGTYSIQRSYSLFSMTDFAPNLHNFGFVLGGVPQYANYLLNRIYDRGMNIEKLKRLAAYVIAETATQDGKVGGPIQMLIITPVEGVKTLSKTEIDNLIKANIKANTKLKQLF